MSTVESPPTSLTLADLLDALGVTADRVMARPAPCTATLDRGIAAKDRGRLCELVEGTLVEKVMGFNESFLSTVLVQLLWNFVERHDLGIVVGADGMIQIAPNQVRMPDVAYYAWASLPDGRFPDGAAPHIAPDLAVEILSPSNGKAEMDRKLGEYFAAGSRLVWYVDPIDRSVRVYTAIDRMTTIHETGTLTGAEVLPGFELPIRQWFTRSERKKP